MRIKIAARVAAVVASALVAVACATPDVTATVTPPPAAGETVTEGTAPAALQSVSLGWVNTPNALHDLVPNSANNQLQLLLNGPGFGFYNADQEYILNPDFGTFEEVSVDEAAGTRTVKATVRDGVTWSDGTPVDAADLLMAWMLNNNRLIPDDANWSWVSTIASRATIGAFPVVSDDGRSITFTFDNLRSDWYLNIGPYAIPAHIVGRLALGIDDPTAAKQAVISAFGGPENYQTQDGTEVPTISHTFNSDLGPVEVFTEPNEAEMAQIAGVLGIVDGENVNAWAANAKPTDPNLLVTMGPYQVADWLEGQYIRLERNPNFNWYGSTFGRPNVDEIIIRFSANPLAQVQALENGEVDMIIPQATVDTVADISRIEGVNYVADVQGTYEHLTLISDNGGPFDPAHWGGNAETARLVRQAFLFTIPREEILDRLIRPIQPDAVVRDSFTQVPGSPTWAQITAGNDSATFNRQDLDQAAALLEEAGITADQLPIHVRILYANDNARRIDQFSLIKTVVDATGLFVVDDGGQPSGAGGWGTVLREFPQEFDAALFAWGSTSTSPNNAESNFITDRNRGAGQATNNIGGFSDPEVDRIWQEIIVTEDEARIAELTTEMEAILFREGFGTPIFQWPGLFAYRDHIENVSLVPFGMDNLWNFWEWNVTN